MSSRYDRVRRYYILGIWSIAMVRNAVVKGWITAEEFQTITGEEYE